MRNLILVTVLGVFPFTLPGQNMRLEELKDEIGFYQLSPEVQFGITEFMMYYDSMYDSFKLALGEVKTKYTFEKIYARSPGDPETHGEIHLEFATGVGLDFSTILCLNHNGDVEHDHSFGRLLENDWSKKINRIEIRETEWEQFYLIMERLLYAWIAFIWQDVKGYETGLKVSIIDGAGSKKFSLNDFHWFSRSNFVDFDEPARRIENQFTKPLTIDEIYKRTGRIK